MYNTSESVLVVENKVIFFFEGKLKKISVLNMTLYESYDILSFQRRKKRKNKRIKTLCAC